MNDDMVEPTPLPNRNAMHYDGRVFERVDWSHRGAYMQGKHGITPAIADEALEDPNRVMIAPRLQQRERQERQDHRILGSGG